MDYDSRRIFCLAYYPYPFWSTPYKVSLTVPGRLIIA